MSKNKVLDTALSIIDKHIHLGHTEIARKIYAETGYCDQDFNMFLSVASSGELTLRSYIRKRKLYFAVCDMITNSEKPLAYIAQEYGYSDQSSFTRAVKAEYGEAPAKLRKTKKEIPDNRVSLENYVSNSSRLEAIFEKFDSHSISGSDGKYFETFIHATEEYGFDTSTCCLISELSEKLSIPFGHLLEKCFEMAIEYDEKYDYEPDEVTEFMMDLGIESEEELQELCQHYNCKWYDLTFIQVTIYRLGIDSKDELERIWKYYDCKWMLGDPYPVTRQMVQDYRNRHK